ncbi:MAG TPA: rhomboid family intramembrane serine protease, partial [Erysipelothrix sp.]|nr:rhomboid family intramembrane serine protease [Erysipelothrix sp.]
TDDIISSDSITKDFKGLNKVLKPTSNFTNAMHKVAGSIQRNMIKIQKREALKATMVTNILFAILGIVFGISYFMTVKFEMNYTEVLLRMGAYYKPLIVEFNQYWRLITPMFLHGDFIHLFMNTLAMRNLGTILEKELGPLRYLMTILSGVLFGSVFLFIKNDPAIGVGISSGIYALLGVLLVYLFEKNLYKNRMILMNITTTILLNLYISLMPNVSMTAHLGGLYVGVILGFIFSKRKDWDQIRKFAQLILVTSIAFLGMLMIQNINIL